MINVWLEIQSLFLGPCGLFVCFNVNLSLIPVHSQTVVPSDFFWRLAGLFLFVCRLHGWRLFWLICKLHDWSFHLSMTSCIYIYVYIIVFLPVQLGCLLWNGSSFSFSCPCPWSKLPIPGRNQFRIGATNAKSAKAMDQRTESVLEPKLLVQITGQKARAYPVLCLRFKGSRFSGSGFPVN